LGESIPAPSPGRESAPAFLKWSRIHRSDTYRAVYTVRFERAVYMLHAFQKKSTKGRKTPQTDVELISRRLRAASDDYEAR
jgi:phage-related protein